MRKPIGLSEFRLKAKKSNNEIKVLLAAYTINLPPS
jgi:hypothetical protein